MQITKSVVLFFVFPFLALAEDVTVTAVTAQQQHPWNGLVDSIVTIQGTAEADCLFAATNSATQPAIPVEHISQNKADTGASATVRPRSRSRSSGDLIVE